MPHQNPTRTFRNRCVPLVGASSAGRNAVRSTAQSGEVPVLSTTTIIRKHNRRNSVPNQSGSLLSSAATTTASWGSMFDFNSIFFPTKTSQHRCELTKQSQCGSSYLFPIDLRATSTSPSTTSCSGDEEYDSSNTSYSSDRKHKIKGLTKFDDACDNSDDSVASSSDCLMHSSPYISNNGGVYDSRTTTKILTSTTEEVIAERWISMASGVIPEAQLPFYKYNQQSSEEGIEIARVASYGDPHYQYSDDSQLHLHRIMSDDDGTETNSTPRYTNSHQNFQCGTQIGSMSTSSMTPFLEQRCNSSSSTNHLHSNRKNQAEYTSHESNSSGGYDQNNEGQSYSSVQETSSIRGGGSVRERHLGASNNNTGMSDDDDNSFRRSDDDNESLSDSDDAEEEEKLRREATNWKTAVDPKSGRTYFYNTQTLETQWHKPLCCASPSERRATIRKEKQTLAFFASMEQNILRTMQQKQQSRSMNGLPHRHHSMVETSPVKINEFKEHCVAPQLRRESEPPTSFQHPYKLIRTISSMEDSVLADLVHRVPSFRNTATTAKNNDTKIGSGATFIPYSRQQDASNADDISSNENNNESSTDVVQRMSARENSLPFGAIFDATKSNRRVGLDANDSNSFNFSALVRLNSVHNSKFNMFDHIPEDENEDNSESCSNHFESSELSPTRGNRSLTRQSGSMNLNKSDLFTTSDDANVDEDEIDDETNQFSYRDSLRRVTGSLSLHVDWADDIKKDPITRENSLNLAEIVGGSRRLNRDPSMALQDAEAWGSYLSESAMRGLSMDEGEAMLELASITDRMGGINSDSSDSSENSVEEDTKVSVENVVPRFHGSAVIAKEMNGMDSSGNLPVVEWNATPELFANKPPRRETGSVSFRPSMIRPTSLRNTPSAAILESVTTKPNKMTKPTISRRNTCGTLYVGSTMSAPDKDATIKCVCAVYRAHILQSTFEVDEIDEKYQVFDDLGANADELTHANLALPSLEDVSIFYRDVFTRAQMESDCIIISLIYVERLIKVTDGSLRPRITNWRSILFSCMVMASKVWDDLSMWNADFSHTCPAGVEFQLSRINELEIAVLSSLQYKVKVPASEYAKYYFLLRSMLIKSGLGSDDLKAINPLDVKGAKQLQHISSQYQASVELMSDRQKAAMGRSKTTGGNHVISTMYSNDGSLQTDSSSSSTPNTSPTSGRQERSKVGLEHMVQL